MKIKQSDYLYDVIENNPYTLLVIEHLKKIDHPKKITIKQFCNKNKLSLPLFLALLNIYNKEEIEWNNDYSIEQVSVIIDFLHHSHTYYKNEKYPIINSLLLELKKYVQTNEVKLLIRFFEDYFNEVKEHLDYEENVVFPYVKDLLNVIFKKSSKKQLNFSSNEYREHHNDIEEKLSDLKVLLLEHLKLKNYTYLSRQIIFHLYELEHDLRAHSKIEEKILIPIIQQLEQMTNG